MKDNTDFDILIVGAGLAGATAAAALAPSGMRIGLLDRSAPPVAPSGDYELRVSSLNRGSEKILRAVGAWKYIDNNRAYPYLKVQVCQANGNANLVFDCSEVGEAYMGHMIENNNLVHALINSCLNKSNIELITGLTISALQTSDNSVQLITDQGTYTTKLLVGADGPRSIIRRLANFEEIRGFYNQQCIVGTVKFDGDHQQTAWQKFLPSGPLGILPLAAGACSLAWSCNNDFAKSRLSESDEAFKQALTDALDGHLGNIISAKRAAFPLGHMHPNRYITHRIALIGDAAHTIHPLAGLGANLGITDAAALAQILLDASKKRIIDPGNFELIRKYERWRKPENQLFLNTMSSFNTLFNDKLSALSGVRDVALAITNRITPAKNILMLKAMGLDKQQPQLKKTYQTT